MKRHLQHTRIATLVLLAFVLCSGFLCTPEQVRSVDRANDTLANALSAITDTAVDLANQHTIEPAERDAILTPIHDATLLSDRIADCTEVANAGNTLRGCVTPLLTTLRDNVNLAVTVRIINTNAQAIVRSLLNAAIADITAVANAGGIQ